MLSKLGMLLLGRTGRRLGPVEGYSGEGWPSFGRCGGFLPHPGLCGWISKALASLGVCMEYSAGQGLVDRSWQPGFGVINQNRRHRIAGQDQQGCLWDDEMIRSKGYPIIEHNSPFLFQGYQRLDLGKNTNLPEAV